MTTVSLFKRENLKEGILDALRDEIFDIFDKTLAASELLKLDFDKEQDLIQHWVISGTVPEDEMDEYKKFVKALGYPAPDEDHSLEPLWYEDLQTLLVSMRILDYCGLWEETFATSKDGKSPPLMFWSVLDYVFLRLLAAGIYMPRQNTPWNWEALREKWLVATKMASGYKDSWKMTPSVAGYA